MLFRSSILSQYDFLYFQNLLLSYPDINLLILQQFETFFELIDVSCFEYFPEIFVSFVTNSLYIDPKTKPQISLDLIPAIITRLVPYLSNITFADLLFKSCKFLKERTSTFFSDSNSRIVSTILSLLLGPFSRFPQMSYLVFRSFEMLIVSPFADNFIKEYPTWDYLFFDLICSTDQIISYSSWRILSKWILKFPNKLTEICKCSKRSILLIDAVKFATSLSILVLIKLISKLIKKLVEPDFHKDAQVNKAGFIFMLAGIPNEILELAALLKDSGFVYNDYVKKAAISLSPEYIPRAKRIIQTSYKVMKERNACNQIFNGKTVAQRTKRP